MAKRSRELERLWRDLSANEDDAGLPETRAPNPGLAAAMHAWAAGETLTDVLDDDEELTGGDFVRHVKQVIDLLHQIGDVGPERRRPRERARRGRRRLLPRRRRRLQPPPPRMTHPHPIPPFVPLPVVVTGFRHKRRGGRSAVIKPGEAWGEPVSEAPDLEVVRDRRGPGRGRSTPTRARWCSSGRRPDSDLARALGHRASGEPGGLAAPIDALRVEPGGTAVNGVVLGTPPAASALHLAERPGPGPRQRPGARRPAARRPSWSRTASSSTGSTSSRGAIPATAGSRSRSTPCAGASAGPCAPGSRRASISRTRASRPRPDARSRSTSSGGRLPLTIDGVARGPVSDLTVGVIPARAAPASL